MTEIDRDGGPAVTPPLRRSRRPFFVLEFEAEIRQLYLRLMDEPVPTRLLGILRAGPADQAR